MSKKRTVAVILATALLIGTLFGCVTALEVGAGIRISDIRRIDFMVDFVAVATDQHYYRIHVGDEIAHPIKIEQLD